MDPYNAPPGTIAAGSTDLGPLFVPAATMTQPANTQVTMTVAYVRQLPGGGSFQPGDQPTLPAGEAAALRAMGAAQ